MGKRPRRVTHTTAYLQRPRRKKELEFKRTWRKQINPSKKISDQDVVKHASSCSLGQLLLTIIIEPTRDPFLPKPSLNIPARLTLSHFKTGLILDVPVMLQHVFFSCRSQMILVQGSEGVSVSPCQNQSAFILSSAAIRRL